MTDRTDRHVTRRQGVLIAAAALVVIITGMVLSMQQGRIGDGLDELNQRGRENQVIRCAELRRAETVDDDEEVAAICDRAGTWADLDPRPTVERP